MPGFFVCGTLKVKYALLVLASPDKGQANLTAARFAAAVINRGHELERVFFYDSGAQTGLASRVAMQGEPDATALWRELAGSHGVELVLCVASALRRGVLDTTEAERHEKGNATMDPAFTIGGLGLLVEAGASADRLVTFGG